MSPAPTSILVVDDDVDTCENLRDILSDLGYDVAVAHGGEEALPLIRRRAFDVALLDFKMPGMDGLMLYRAIRKVSAGTVVVIISAFAGDETIDRALHAGVSRVLHKPVDFDQLLPLIEKAARQPLVMLVDDDHDLCASLWDILRERDFRVDIAHTEPEAAAQLTGRQYGIVLIDLKLQEGDGSDVFHFVRRLNPSARVVVITGFRNDFQDTIEQILQEGADAVCYKPFEMTELIGTIGRLVESVERTR